MQRKYDFREPESKTAFFREVAKKLLEFEPGIERNNYTEAVASRYHLTYEQLQRMVSQTGEQLGGMTKVASPAPPPGRKRPEEGSLKSQKLLITWMCSGEKIFRSIAKYVEPEEFTDPLCRKVAELLTDQLKEGRLNPPSLFQYFTEEEEQQKVAAMCNDTIPDLSGREAEEKALQETIRRVKQNSIAWQTEHLDPGDMDALQKLIRRRRDIEKLHISLD